MESTPAIYAAASRSLDIFFAGVVTYIFLTPAISGGIAPLIRLTDMKNYHLAHKPLQNLTAVVFDLKSFHFALSAMKILSVVSLFYKIERYFLQTF